VQKEKLKQGLNTAIPSSNKGFALLSKMGFKPGQGIGNSQSAIKEPIKINLPTDGRLGLGTETAIKESRERQLNNLKRKIDASDLSTEEYRKQFREMSDKRQNQWDLHKLQRTCRMIDMDNRVNNPIHAFFWPEEKSKKNEEEDDDDEDEGATSSKQEDKNELTVMK
jgi:hypothetical protein